MQQALCIIFEASLICSLNKAGMTWRVYPVNTNRFRNNPLFSMTSLPILPLFFQGNNVKGEVKKIRKQHF